MKSICLLGSVLLLAGGINGSIEAVHPGRFIRRATALTTPDDPTQTGTISTCNLWYDVVAGDTCASVETAFGITSAQFLAWNPAVSSDCTTNFWVGDSYCVGIGSGSPVTSTTTASSSTRTAETTGPDKPTQTGQPSDCDAWYDVVPGDTCASIEAAFGITSAQFLGWNPTVSSDCTTNFWTGYSYCVGVNPNKTSTITSGSSSSVTSTSPPGTYSIIANETSAVLAPMPTASGFPPTPTQSGIISGCIRYYQATAGDTCQTIVNQYSHLITIADFVAWNPSVGGINCTGLYVNWYYCVDAPMDQSNLPNATTQYLPGWTPIGIPQMNSTFAPYPTATGLVSTCQSYYEANQGDTCANVTSSLGYLSVAEFEEWNVGVNCNNLTIATYYCVANFTNLPLPSTVSTLPSPVQSGITSSCTSWYQATTGDDCSLIPQYFGTFTEAQFLSWNPALNSDCSGLIVGDYYCVAIPGTPTTPTVTMSPTSLPTNGVGPQPEQPGIPSTCSSYWFVGETDNCTTIATANDITIAELVEWNPALNSDCSGLQPNYYVCISVPDATPTGSSAATSSGTSSSSSAATSSGTSSSSSAVPTTTSAVPSTTTAAGSSTGTPSPIQAGMVSGCERFYLVESGDGCYAIATAADIALSDFYTWNPAVGSSCGGLQAGVYVCVGVTGPPSTVTAGPPVPATPSPTQTGMVSGCVRFYDVQSGDGCYNIATDAGIALSTFYSWNPAVGSSCQGLEAAVFVCIGTSGPGTTITSGTPVAAPTTS